MHHRYLNRNHPRANPARPIVLKVVIYFHVQTSPSLSSIPKPLYRQPNIYTCIHASANTPATHICYFDHTRLTPSNLITSTTASAPSATTAPTTPRRPRSHRLVSAGRPTVNQPWSANEFSSNRTWNPPKSHIFGDSRCDAEMRSHLRSSPLLSTPEREEKENPQSDKEQNHNNDNKNQLTSNCTLLCTCTSQST